MPEIYAWYKNKKPHLAKCGVEDKTYSTLAEFVISFG